ncbi:unnamed protein product [Oppiella nova]|uniref:Uncharacterized protein n=1 Tax=Oppiella nova TaxID=334625 RepID=A0A7R9M586_9ACAR|nr:unnamed protein product [Oppiella nova]CAG2171004.1 unnamed protein product [Oppiella nova]
MNVISNTRVSYKLRRFYEFLCLLTVEPYFFAFMFVFAMKKVPSDQLIQDKICRLTYKLDTTYCTLLPTMSANEDYFNMNTGGLH